MPFAKTDDAETKAPTRRAKPAVDGSRHVGELKAWMQKLGYWAGAPLRPARAKILLGLTQDEWQKRNKPADSEHARSIRTTERILMALYREVLTPDQQAAAERIARREGDAD